jgi:hypothetical protein
VQALPDGTVHKLARARSGAMAVGERLAQRDSGRR